MRRLVAGGLLAAIAMVPAASSGAADEQRRHEAHEHGAARLDVVLDGSDLVVALHTPAANVVGFEHEPRDAAEREALATSLQRLRDGDGLFELAADALCRLDSVDIDTPLSNEDHAGEEEHAHAGEDGHGHEEDPDHAERHADVDVTWAFHCESPAALDAIGVGLFDRFDGFEAVEVQFVGPAGQSAARLTPDNAVIAW